MALLNSSLFEEIRETEARLRAQTAEVRAALEERLAQQQAGPSRYRRVSHRILDLGYAKSIQ